MNNSKPTISVVIPAYNEEKYLPKTLASIAKLERKPDEVIVVNASSTDRTKEVAQSMGATVLTVERKTIGYSRQAGLLAAKGDVVACTDADDLVPVDWLTKIESTLNEDGVVGVYGHYLAYDGPLTYRLYVNYINPVVFFLTNKLGIYLAPGQNIAFWREKAISVGGFPETFRSVEDMEIIRRLGQIGRIRYLPNNPVSTSGRRGKEGFGMIVRVLGGLIAYFRTGKADAFYFPDIR